MKARHISGGTHSNRRGTATVEAILMLTVFLLLWAGTRYMGELYTTQMQQEVKARGCAWIVASSGCKQIPPECQTEEASASEPEESNLLRQALSLAESETASDDDSDGDTKAASRVQDQVDQEISGLFSKRTRISATKERAAPPLLGGGSRILSASHQLPCNSVPRAGESLSDEIFRSAKP